MSKFAPHRGSANNPRATSSTLCQKCLRTGSSYNACTIPPSTNRPHDSQQVTSRTSAKPLGRTSRARRARHSSKIRVSLRNQRRTASHPSTSRRSSRTSSCCPIIFSFCAVEGFLIVHIHIHRSGTADRILEAKEKQREKEKTDSDRAKKRAKRSVYPYPF